MSRRPHRARSADSGNLGSPRWDETSNDTLRTDHPIPGDDDRRTGNPPGAEQPARADGSAVGQGSPAWHGSAAGHGASGHGASGHGRSGHDASGHGASGRGASGRGGRRNRPPLLLLVPAVLGLAFLTLPLVGLVVNAPWQILSGQLLAGETWQALRLSLTCATLATACSLLLGVPVGWLLARGDLPGRRLIRALVTVPLVLPPVVGGVALLFVLGRNGLVGQWLDAWFGISLPFSTAAVVIAETFVAMPFLILSVEGSLRSADRRYEEAAATLGASGWLTFRRVTLPMVAPGLLAGAILAWARALGEFGATITFAGNFPGTTQTMPLAVYVALERNPDEAVLLSLVLLAVSLIVLIALRNRWLPTGGER